MGPPTTNEPVGFTYTLRFGLASSYVASTGSMMSRSTSALIWDWVTSARCCVDTTTVSIATGVSPSYSMVTWVLPSGRR